MNTSTQFFARKSRWILSLAILVSLFGLFLAPVVTYAQVPVSPAEDANEMCSSPYSDGVTCSSFLGVITTGTCMRQRCVATGIGAIGTAVSTAVLSGTAMLLISRAINGPPGGTGSSYPGYTSTNPYGQATCTGTRYISPAPTNDPCGVYIPISQTPTTPTIPANPTTPTTPGPATGTLSITPTTGTAPLAVTLTVTDTSTACSHPAIMISAGDGTDTAIAIPTTTSCAGRIPQVFTYTYRTAGTYQAKIISAGTQQILQTVTVTVSAANTTTTTPATTAITATLSAVPTSGSAPLPVTFTVTDTSSSCSHPDIMISAGDGSEAALAIPGNSGCAGRAPVTFNPYIYRTAGTYQAKIFNASTRQVIQAVTITVDRSTATTTSTAATTTTANTTNDRTSATLTAVPTSGPAPLTVRLTVTDTTTVCPRSEVTLSVITGSRAITALPATTVCGGSPPISFDYMYQTPGIYRAEIANTNTNRVLQAVTINVGGASSILSTNVGNSTGGVNISSSLLNLSGGTGSATRNAARTATARPATPIQPSTWGNIQATASGVTITGGGHDTDGRTGIAGFYGYDAVPGVTPQALAQKLCNARPWAGSSATPVIPPSFFDSICTARGYKAGTPVPAASAGAGTASIPPASSAASRTATTTGKRPAGPTVAAVPAKVYIMAVPSSVKIGSRTSIFWNAVGVKSCRVTSPDGSFSGNTLSGAASTVAITGETVFSIACIKPDDSQISNFVRVKIAI